MPQMKNFDIATIRARLGNAEGPEFWRSLNEIAASEDFKAALANEFSDEESRKSGHLDRREFLAMISTSLALTGLGGLAGCAATAPENIVPYVRQPEEIV